MKKKTIILEPILHDQGERRRKILVADDDPAIVDCLQIILEDAGYTVITTTDDQTIRMIKEEKPNVILLDVWMSGNDGRDTCKYLKSQGSTRDIPVILVSATRDLAESARKAGAEDFITKPFQMDQLLAKVARYAGVDMNT